ncbi:hypothetical protein [Aquimarina rubra]|uniref:Uncharacterized protein n=1 Tax=Aquimarina rubra TaxID=1920033 RepID=A0ABW5LEC9_9FLAO
MKFNKTYEGESFEKYAEYLQFIKNRIPEKLFCFVSNPERHDLGEKSLHDARIKKIEYELISKDNYEMTLLLLGENREFKIRFVNVSQLHMNQVNFGDMYKDLITYEVGIEKDALENDKLVFRAQFPFENGIIEVFSENIEIEENFIQRSR